MSTEKPFRKISELVKALTEAEQGMSAGTLALEGLETACHDARELFERFVVLRHKARETKLGITSDPVDGRSSNKAAVPLEKVENVEPLRLDTRPEEISSRQTSLIEAIESTEQERTEEAKEEAPKAKKDPAKPPASPAKSAPSVAEKLEKAPVDDLGKVISLSHKFWFVAELFNGDRITYEKTIEKLNRFADHKEAEAYVQQEVFSKLKKPADPEALSTFNELVQRRYA